jgi:hypothetical protein
LRRNARHETQKLPKDTIKADVEKVTEITSDFVHVHQFMPACLPAAYPTCFTRVSFLSENGTFPFFFNYLWSVPSGSFLTGHPAARAHIGMLKK